MSIDEGLKWFHEGRMGLENAETVFTATNSLNATALEGLVRGIERAIKGVAKAAHVPFERTHGLTALCQDIGVWNILPVEHRWTLNTLDRYGAMVGYPDDLGYVTFVQSTSPYEAQQIVSAASSLFDYLENDAVKPGSVVCWKGMP